MKKIAGMTRACKLAAGVALLLFFVLLALGWLGSPQKAELLPVLMISVALPWLSWRLLRGTGRGQPSKAVQTPLPMAIQDTAPAPRTCASCGATDTPDENDCCQYCGAQLGD